MDTDQEQTAPEADDSETSGSPAQTVRVPNVNPYAKSGLDHQVIGADALDPDTSDEDDGDEDEPGEQLPDGDTDAHVAWVAEAEDSATAHQRADLVYANAEKSGPSPEWLADLAAKLRAAVYADPIAPPAGDEGLTVAPDSQVPGTIETTMAEPGPAENAETGEVTQPGEPLPTIEQTDGTPLEPADGDTPDGGAAGSS